MDVKTKCNICQEEETSVLDEHHIQSKSLGGSNHPSNKTYICTKCHRFVHHGLLILEGWWDTTNGTTLVWRKYNEESVTGIEDPKVWLYPNAKIYSLKKTCQ